MASWGFLTTRARVLLRIAHDPGARLRDIAATLSVTERLAQAGHLIRQKDGRRNRYQVQAHLPLPGPGTREPASGAGEFRAGWRCCSSPAWKSPSNGPTAVRPGPGRLAC